MPYASFHEDPSSSRAEEVLEERGGLSLGKSIAKIYGYMGIGLLITGVVAYFVAWLFSSRVNEWLAAGIEQGAAKAWSIGLIVTWIVALIGILILSFVIPRRAASSGKSLWFPYLLYCVFMGILMTAILLAGISFYIIAEAFGITTAIFLVMFLIGWFSKKDLSILGYIGFMLLFLIIAVSIFGGIFFWIRGGNTDTRFWFDLGITAAIIVVMAIITIFDTWRIRKIVEASGESQNVHLYCAYVMYTDFITILLHIISFLARVQRK